MQVEGQDGVEQQVPPEQNNSQETIPPQQESSNGAPPKEEVPGNGIQDIADLLGLSAEEPKKEEEAKKPEEQKPQVSGKPEEKPGAIPAQAPSNEAPKQEEQKTPEPGKELKDLLQQVLAEQKGEKKEEEQKAPEAEKPFYQPVVPKELMAAIEHEDPGVRQQGISALIGGAMNQVRRDLMAEFKGQLQAFGQQVPQVVEARQKLQDEALNSRKTFYEANPNFATTPERQQLVAMMGVQLAQQMGKDYKGMTPEFQAKLAQTFEAATGIKAGKAPAAPKVPEVPPKKPGGFQTGASPTRTSDPVQTLSDEIFDVVSMH